MTSPEAIAASDLDIAVIGFSGRFPGAADPLALWDKLLTGAEATTFFSPDELERAGIARFDYNDPQYVKAYPLLNDTDLFDAEFFGISPKEAQLTDPQQRIFLECAVEALEFAGYDPARYRGSIGVYAGGGTSLYYMRLLQKNAAEISESGVLKTMAVVGNDKDYLATRVSYKLDLRGPSVNVQTACSTSLVATHLACQGLQNGECDIALAGGASVTNHWGGGYRAVEGGLLSPDGHCRPFDAKANGTVFGDGIGIVVLKPLGRAVKDGDTIWGIIKGSAINNDGALKSGFTAPSVDQQAQVVMEALEVAGVSPDMVGYVEAHGTGTVLGDPIEVEALTRVFRRSTNRMGFCYLGSLKANVGHLVAAAGVAGLIKVLLAFHHQTIPPLANFHRPNPEIPRDGSPFILNTEPVAWRRGDNPRLAGVSSFGVGGTNAHLVVEEPPEIQLAGSAKKRHMLLLSARNEVALDQLKARLAQHLKDNPTIELADVAHTLSVGRTFHRHAEAIVCKDQVEAIEALTGAAPFRTIRGTYEARSQPKVAFMFPGQGSQHVNMARDLYDEESSVFRAEVDRCAAVLRRYLDFDLIDVLYPAPNRDGEPSANINETMVAQPAIFAVSYALAKHWMALGINPSGMIGHSIGEYVAACIAGVFSLEDALHLVAVRARGMQDCPRGSMLAIGAEQEVWQQWVDPAIATAAINGPSSFVVSGPSDAIAKLNEKLMREGIARSMLKTSHAYHSPLMADAAERLRQVLREIELNPPNIPYLSNVTGTWADAATVCDIEYWTRHLLNPVRFADNVRTLLDAGIDSFVEVGPGRTLCTLARENLGGRKSALLTSLPSPNESDVSALDSSQRALAQLWLQGCKVDWSKMYPREFRRRIPLPTYPFQRQRFVASSRDDTSDRKERDYLDRAFQIPVWRRLAPSIGVPDSRRNDEVWLVFGDDGPIDAAFLAAARSEVGTVVQVLLAERFDHIDDVSFGITQSWDHVRLLLATLKAEKRVPNRVVYLWATKVADEAADADGGSDGALRLAFFTPLYLAKAIGEIFPGATLEIDFVGAATQAVIGGDLKNPMGAMALGPSLVIPAEYPEIETRFVDLPERDVLVLDPDRAARNLLRELVGTPALPVVAHRGLHRWTRGFERISMPAAGLAEMPIRQGGTYLITGGLGDLGLAIAGFLAERFQAKLALVSRTALPAPDRWPILAASGENSREASIIRQIAALEKFGSEVMVGAGDVARLDEFDAVVRSVRARFDAVHGVIHAAGVAGIGPIGMTDKDDALRVLAPKVLGLANIKRVFDDNPLDFLALFSSVNAIHGQVGQIGYAAANIYLDAVAEGWQARCARRVVSINWDAWSEIGMAVNTPLPPRLQEYRREALRYGLLTTEGVEAFARILAGGGSRVAVSHRDMNVDELRRRREREANTNRADAGSASATAKAESPNRGNWAPRPNMRQAYVAPKTAIEIAVAEIWGALLQLYEVGVEDDFFELGGDSLMALHLIPRLRTRFQVDIAPIDLFAAPTVSKLSFVIERRLVSDLAAMSDEEVRRAIGVAAGSDQEVTPDGAMAAIGDQEVTPTGAMAAIGDQEARQAIAG
jgi:phthiocerol/phenolphthiocerol synthesis type-I polyketide synthase E